MKWRSKKIVEVKSNCDDENSPKIGDIKEKIKFAYFPVKIDQKKYLRTFFWWDYYTEIWEYRKIVISVKTYSHGMDERSTIPHYIESCEWVLKERVIK